MVAKVLNTFRLDGLTSKNQCSSEQLLFRPPQADALNTEDRFTRDYLFKDQRKVFFAVSSGMCNLKCPYCITNRPGFKQNLDKDDFSFIFDYFGENIYFVFSGLGDFFCGYQAKDELLRFLLRHNIAMFLDINGVDIKELADRGLEGKEKIDMIDISYHFGAMKKQKVLKRWINSVKSIHEGGYNYYIKMIPSPQEKEIWEEATLFYAKEALPITGKKLMLFPDTNISADLHNQLNELEHMTAKYKDIVNILGRESLFKKTAYPSGNTPLCPAGSRYFRVLNTGEIMPCSDLHSTPLGNVKKKDVITLKGDVSCNLTGFCDCGWAINPRVVLMNAHNEPYARRTLYEYGSNLLELPLPEETDDITIFIDRLEEDAQIVKNMRIEGRAFVDGAETEQHDCCLVLKSEKNTYIFDTRKIHRPDALSHFEAVNSYDSGFSAFIPKGDLEAGEYKVGFYIRKPDTGQESLKYTEHRIAIDHFSGFSIRN